MANQQRGSENGADGTNTSVVPVTHVYQERIIVARAQPRFLRPRGTETNHPRATEHPRFGRKLRMEGDPRKEGLTTREDMLRVKSDVA